MLMNPDLSLKELNISSNLDDSLIASILSYKWNGTKPINLILDLDATLVHAVEVSRLPKEFMRKFKPGLRGCFEIRF